MKIDSRVLIDKINAEMKSEKPDNWPHRLFGLEVAKTIIREEVERQKGIEEYKKQIGVFPGFTSEVHAHDKQGDWLYLPGLRLYLNTNNIRSIGLHKDENSVRVYFLSGEGIDYFGEDFKAIWDYVEKRSN